MIGDQFRTAHDFLTNVRQAFTIEVPQRNLFLVPGNHDVNQDRITTFETAWLKQEKSLDTITDLLIRVWTMRGYRSHSVLVL